MGITACLLAEGQSNRKTGNIGIYQQKKYQLDRSGLHTAALNRLNLFRVLFRDLPLRIYGSAAVPKQAIKQSAVKTAKLCSS